MEYLRTPRIEWARYNLYAIGRSLGNKCDGYYFEGTPSTELYIGVF